MIISETEEDSGFCVLDARCPVCHYKVKVMYPVLTDYNGQVKEATGLCKRHSLVDIADSIYWIYI